MIIAFGDHNDSLCDYWLNFSCPSLTARDRDSHWSRFQGLPGDALTNNPLQGHHPRRHRQPPSIPLHRGLDLVFGAPVRRRTLTTPRRLEGSKQLKVSISGLRTPCLRALTVNGLLLPGSVATRVETLPPGIGTFVGSRRYRSRLTKGASKCYYAFWCTEKG